MLTTKDICWMAGLLEGEGCFLSNYNRPVIRLEMTDKDVVQKFADYFKKSVYIKQPSKSQLGIKIIYQVVLTGYKAAGLMMTIYQFMGERRKERIKDVLGKWKSIKVNLYSASHYGSKVISKVQ